MKRRTYSFGSTCTGCAPFLQQQTAGKRPATARRPAAIMIAILAQPAGHQIRATTTIAAGRKTLQQQIFITHPLVSGHFLDDALSVTEKRGLGGESRLFREPGGNGIQDSAPVVSR
jgi:hypothetical protein